MLHLLLLTLVLVSTHALAQKTCWWPSGTSTEATKSDYAPCFTNGTDGQCCKRGEACLSNGLCYGASLGWTYRGACTDKTWSAALCPSYCSDIYSSQFADVFACDTGMDAFWCGTGNFCSSTNGSVFSYPLGGSVYSLAGSEAFSTLNATFTTSNDTANATSPRETATITVASAASSRVSRDVPIGVGVGVGIPLALASVAFAILYMRERKARKSAEQRVAETSPSSSATYMHMLPGPGYTDVSSRNQRASWQTRPPELSGESEIAELGGNKPPGY